MAFPQVHTGFNTPVPYWAAVTITTLLSIILTAGAYYLVLGGDVVTRTEVEEKLDRIQQTISSIDRRLARIEGRQNSGQSFYKKGGGNED